MMVYWLLVKVDLESHAHSCWFRFELESDQIFINSSHCLISWIHYINHSQCFRSTYTHYSAHTI